MACEPLWLHIWQKHVMEAAKQNRGNTSVFSVRGLCPRQRNARSALAAWGGRENVRRDEDLIGAGVYQFSPALGTAPLHSFHGQGYPVLRAQPSCFGLFHA